MRVRSWMAVGTISVSLSLVGGQALAEEPTAPAPITAGSDKPTLSTDPCAEAAAAAVKTAGTGTYTLPPVCIKGRPQKPNVAVDVSRLVPRAPLPELRKPLIDRIARAAERDPF